MSLVRVPGRFLRIIFGWFASVAAIFDLGRVGDVTAILTLYQRNFLVIKMATPASASHGLYQLLETGCEVPYERVKQLLVQGANPFSPFDTDESCALFLCVERNDESLVQLLLDRNWNQSGKKSSKRLFITNFEGLSALMLAARQGYSGCINLLLSAGFNSPELLNMRASGGSSHGSTALMLACVGQHINAAKSLLENGADPSISDSEGCSPMHIAAMQGNLDLIEALKEHGGLLQVVDKQGNTPMHFCVHANVLEYLYQEGVSPSTRYAVVSLGGMNMAQIS